MELLRTYHSATGKLIFHFEGTVERFARDGIMVFFNDPVPTADYIERAVRMPSKCAAPSRNSARNGLN